MMKTIARACLLLLVLSVPAVPALAAGSAPVAARQFAPQPRSSFVRDYFLDGFTGREYWNMPEKANRNPLKLAGQMLFKTAVAPIVIPAGAAVIWAATHPGGR
jgi:hypothetical protein